MKLTAAAKALGLSGLAAVCACNDAVVSTGSTPSTSASISSGVPVGSSATPGTSASAIYQQVVEATFSPRADGKIDKAFDISFSGNEPAESFVQLYFPAPHMGQTILEICGNTNWGGITGPCGNGLGKAESGLESQDVSVNYLFQVFVNHVKVAEWGGSTMMNHSSTISTSYNWGS